MALEYPEKKDTMCWLFSVYHRQLHTHVKEFLKSHKVNEAAHNTLAKEQLYTYRYRPKCSNCATATALWFGNSKKCINGANTNT